MKRVTLTLASVALVAAFVLPAALGMLAERRHAEILAELIGQPDAADIRLVSYQRGWFSSRARYRVRVVRDQEQSDSGERRTELIIDSQISHGPLLLSGETKRLTPVLARVHSTLALDTEDEQWRLPGVFETHIGLGRAGDLKYYSEPVNKETPGGQMLTWEGGEVVLLFDASENRLVIKGQIGRFRLAAGPEQNFIAGPMRFDSTLSRSPGRPWTGTTSVYIDEIAQTRPAAPGVFLADVSVLTFFDAGDDGYSFGVRAGSESVRTGDRHGGNAVVDFRVAGLDADALRVSVASLRERAVSSTSGTWTIDAQAALAELKPLLRRGAVVELEEVTFPTPHGNVTARMNFELKPQDDTVEYPNMIAALDAGLSLRLPRTLTDWAVEQDSPNSDVLRKLIDYGLLKSAGDYYSIAATYASGVLTVNGASLPVPLQTAGSQRPNVELQTRSNPASGR